MGKRRTVLMVCVLAILFVDYSAIAAPSSASDLAVAGQSLQADKTIFGGNKTTTSTPKPTEPPTPKPTEPSTPKPTEPPTPKPTEPPTPKPTEPPTPKPTEPTPGTTSTISPPSPSPCPKPDRSFDVSSFLGGVILSVGLMAIGYVVFKFYRARTDPNYRSL